MAGEVGELLEILQWLSPQQAAEVMHSGRADDVRDELADVTIYLVQLADILDVDLTEVAHGSGSSFGKGRSSCSFSPLRPSWSLGPVPIMQSLPGRR